ncbi:5'-adenylylsulfate reductase-like 5 [Vitis riparia]|uniref:5'-adenylylsulfate reductase-like 5 n=1 Tax=Vitis riparia TaxID=96939 RepID=UPI00155A3633|nr:5'-adenylylsulfate reductase-like 5 [Vitis riparia]
MATSVAWLLFLYIGAVSSLPGTLSSSVCPLQSDFLVAFLQSQCPLSLSSHALLDVDGNFLDRALTSKQGNGFTSVLFHASWCPFSCKMRPKFEVLSSMFPQIEHLAIKESSASPSMFSRYGIHSLPSILIVNQTSRMRYHGPKDLPSLVKFYRKTTGLEPVQYFAEDQTISFEKSEGQSILQPWNGSYVKEIFTREPYLAFSILFFCLRVVLALFPGLLSQLKAFWVLYVPHLNLEIFGETSQMLGRVLNMIDVQRVWAKLKLCKIRNFREGAKSARVWASSLASVSLGETSSGSSS